MIELVEEGFVQCLLGKEVEDLEQLRKSIADAKPRPELFRECDYDKSSLKVIAEICAFLPRKFLQITVGAVSRRYATVVMTRMRASAPYHVLRRVDLHYEQSIEDDANEKPDEHVAFIARVERVGKNFENHEYVYPLERLMESASVCGVPPYFRVCEVRVRGYPYLATPNTIHWLNKLFGMFCRMKSAWNLDHTRLDSDYSFPSKAVIDRGSYFHLQNMLIHVLFTAQVDIIMNNNADTAFFLRDIFHYPSIGITCKTLRLGVHDYRTIGVRFRNVESVFYLLGWLHEPIDKHYPNSEEDEENKENVEKPESNKNKKPTNNKCNSGSKPKTNSAINGRQKTVTSLKAGFKSSVTGGQKYGKSGASTSAPKTRIPISTMTALDKMEKMANCHETWKKSRVLGLMVGTLPEEIDDVRRLENRIIKELDNWSEQPFYTPHDHEANAEARFDKIRESPISNGNRTLYRMTKDFKGKRDYLCVESETEAVGEDEEPITWKYFRVLPLHSALRNEDVIAFLESIHDE